MSLFHRNLNPFQSAASVLSSRVGQSTRATALRTVSQFAIALWVSWVQALMAFKAGCFGVLSLRCTSWKLGCQKWGSNPLLLREKPGVLSTLPIPGRCTRGGVYGKTDSYFNIGFFPYSPNV